MIKHIDNKKDSLESLFGNYSKLPIQHENEWEIISNFGPFCVCTNCARYVVQKVGGIVVGFGEGTNPTSHKEFVDGHDFALVEGRYLVDIWGKFFAGTSNNAVIDLENKIELKNKLTLYGEIKTWTVLDKPVKTMESRFDFGVEKWVYFDPKKHFHENVLKNLEIISVISHDFIR